LKKSFTSARTFNTEGSKRERSANRFSSQAIVLQEAEMPFPAEDNMVQHGNAESFAGLLELPGEQNVLSAWSKVNGKIKASKKDYG